MAAPEDSHLPAHKNVELDSDRLAAVVSWLKSLEGANIHSILVARRDVLVFEHYRAGPDERWGTPLPAAEHGIETKHDLRSITKVVIGLLAGQVLAASSALSLDARIFDLLPAYADLRSPAKYEITIRHLLTMSAGLEWDENVALADPDHGELRLWRADDPLRCALEPRIVAKPGTLWNYSGACSELLAAVLEKVAGRPVDELARDLLFEPLGIEDFEWARLKSGSPSASGGLRLNARDLAKLGSLVSMGGRWGERSLLPQDWIRDAISPQIGAPDRLFFYGYHWWLGRSLLRKREVTWAAGLGLGGQRLFILPEFDIVVVITAGHYADAMQAWLPLTILNRFVLPSLR